MLLKTEPIYFNYLNIIFCCLILSTGICFGSGTWKQLVSDYSITAIQAYDGGYWFGAGDAGALRYDNASGKWHRYNKNNGYMNQNHSVNDMKIMHGKVWFATNYGMYSCELDGTGWQQHILPGDYLANWVRGLDANSSHIWIASFSGLYTRPASGGSFVYQDISVSGIYASGIGASVSAGDSLVWIGTDNGFDTASETVACRAVNETESGLWIGLEEYTPSTNPSYCLGGLFHKRGDDWFKYDQHNGLPAAGIHFIHEYGDKIYAGLFHYVNGVDFNGAGLLEMDLQDSSMRVLTADNWHIGNDGVRSFYVNGADTLVGTEEGLYSNIGGMNDMVPYEAPQWFSVRNTGNGEVEITIDPVNLATQYAVYYSTDNTSFEDSLILTSTCDTLDLLTENESYYFKVAGMNDSGVGPLCKDMLACSVSATESRVILIQAFQKTTIENTYDYVIQHGEAFRAHGLAFDAASKGALGKGHISLNDYEVVDWIAGLDQESLNHITKPAISGYLRSGGKLFISGSYLLENLSGTSSDPYFYSTYLKAVSKKQSTDTYKVMPVSESLFEGFSEISFDHNDGSTYRVYRPDGFSPAGGAKSALVYSGTDTSANGSATLQYSGTFADSEEEAALVYLGFPFESIESDSMRNAMMGSILHYFGYDVTLTSIAGSDMPLNFSLDQNYPNPFNAETRISYVVPEDAYVSLDVYDISGRKVRRLLESFHSAGRHTVSFRADDLPAGVYIYKLSSGSYRSVRKMILLK